MNVVADYATQSFWSFVAVEIPGLELMHCDLHSGNVCVLKDDDMDDFKVTVIDLGFSKVRIADGTILWRDNSRQDVAVAHEPSLCVGTDEGA